MNISNFIIWFINQFINIGRYVLSLLDNIIIYGNITLMDFIITLAIISAFISIIITAPRLNIINKIEKRSKNDTRK